uniref:Secreted protein n=1 Tax=Plectus sambesii TaxID=2011161 RepID=A0A914UZK3_9BILA
MQQARRTANSAQRTALTTVLTLIAGANALPNIAARSFANVPPPCRSPLFPLTTYVNAANLSHSESSRSHTFRPTNGEPLCPRDAIDVFLRHRRFCLEEHCRSLVALAVSRSLQSLARASKQKLDQKSCPFGVRRSTNSIRQRCSAIQFMKKA